MKNHLHFFWGLIVGVVLLMSGHVDAQNYSLKIKTMDGTEKEFSLSNLTKITFPNTYMNLFFQNATSESLTVSSIQSMLFTTPTGVYSSTFENVLSVYPNPAGDYIVIKNLKTEDKQVRIFDAAGTLVKSVSIGNVVQHIEVSNLSRGLYFIRISNQMLKFIKL